MNEILEGKGAIYHIKE